MMTSKHRAELRSRANTIETTLMIGKGGITDNVILEAERLLDAKELVKGKVLETAMMDPGEASDMICEATGAEGVQVVGTKFVIYRMSAKLEAERQAKAKTASAKKENPVRAGVQARRKKAKEEKKQRKAYFRDAAVQAAIQRRREREGDI